MKYVGLFFLVDGSKLYEERPDSRRVSLRFSTTYISIGYKM